MQNYLDQHFARRVVLALVFSIVFMVIGQVVPDTYYRYFDNKQYYTVVQPMPVDKKWYKPCESVQITGTVTSLVNTNLDMNIELILRKSNNTVLKIPDLVLKKTTIAKAEARQTVLIAYPLPCDLEDGLYYWQMLVTYKIYGYDRHYFAVTDTFNVNSDGNDPEFMKASTASATLRPSVPAKVVEPVIVPTSTQSKEEPQTQSSTTVNMDGCCTQPTPQQNKSAVEEVLDTVKNLIQ